MYHYLLKIKELCTGCGACINCCPVDAIEYKELEKMDASIVAKIDQKKCINCGQCRVICPQINCQYSTNSSSPACYAVMASDKIRKKSSSGGAFTIFAEHILAKGGEVCAVASNESFEAYHTIISDINELDKLRKSKYMQSKVGYIYRDIKKKLEKGKFVLFVGCPCQVAGLKSFLGKKYNNLYLIDLFCNYAPSPLVYRKYLHENYEINNIKNIEFRIKDQGWVCDIHKISYKNGRFEEKRIENDAFQKGYHSRLFMRKVCENCRYAGFPREGDFSIGDFWYIDHFVPGLDDSNGTSCVLLNNERAEAIFNEVKDKWKLRKKVGLECLQYNRTVGIKAHFGRDRFYELFWKISFNMAVEKSMSGRYDAVVWGCWSEKNYGSELTYYALYKFLESLNLDVLMVERPRKAEWRPYGEPILFRDNPYPGGALCELFSDKKEMRSLNNISDLFIVGSDQIWNSNLYRAFGEVGCLDYIFNDKKKIAFAASFGRDCWHGDQIETQNMSIYLNDFDSISVREQCGVDICRNIFGVKAQRVLDPVFMCDPSVYLELANKSNKNLLRNYIAAYILDIDEHKQKLMNQIESELNIPICVMTDAFDESIFDKNAGGIKPFVDISCEDWLKIIICSDFVITDSFHGICFAIIFKKQFIAITNRKRGLVRVTELLARLNLSNQLLYEEDLPSGLDKSIFKPISYESVYKLLEEEKKNTKLWLKYALELPKKTNITKYDILFQQFVEEEWRLDKKIQEESGARRWDISIHQSHFNCMFRQINELQAKLEDNQTVINEYLCRMDEKGAIRQMEIDMYRSELNEQLQQIRFLNIQNVKQKEELDQLQKMYMEVQRQLDCMKCNWLIRLSRKISGLKEKLLKN